MLELGVPVTERLVSAEELFQAAENGRLEEAWGSGTLRSFLRSEKWAGEIGASSSEEARSAL
jgi:branched-subunit amino acid aminotransferase/4-amino-4-deoxychorismate lyase